MVVTEFDGEVLLFEQHEHAKSCGILAEAWCDEKFLGKKWRDNVTYAIYEHDNGWIELDEKPLINHITKLPYSFIDYPLEPKLMGYTTGINRIENKDQYAAFLCSLHYCSFFEQYTNGRGEDFLTQERKRQQKLRKILSIEKDNAELKFHYNLLQFCDNLSLYLCMNQPGVSKTEEMIWFRNGFTQKFPYNNYKRLIAHWLDEETVALNDFPFKQEVQLSIKYKAIDRRKLNQLQEEYSRTGYEQRTVTIISR